jgi:N-ethylmaleimide reductase
MSDSDPVGLFSYVAEQLVLGNVDDESKDQRPVAAQLNRQHYKGAIIAAGGFKGDTAEAIVKAGDADLVAF